MYLRSRSKLGLLAALAAGVIVAGGAGTVVLADSPVGTPVVTSQPPSTVPPVTAPPVQQPTVLREQPTPVVSHPPVPTRVPQRPSPRPAAATAAPSTNSGASTGPSSGFTSSGQGPDTAPADSSLLPSAAQLRESARLRWGNGIPATVKRWAFLIIPAARKYHIDPNLIAAVMTMESNGDPTAQSYADARGLMQILHGPWDPAANVDEGARELARYLGEFHGSVALALAAYNAGEGAVLQYGGVPPYRETQDYVVIVQYLYDLFSHHKLGQSRQHQYKSTLKDLQRFSDQRKKVPKLAHIARVGSSSGITEGFVASCRHFSRTCDLQHSNELFSTLDPFWPVAGPPDPLQKVDPDSASG